MSEANTLDREPRPALPSKLSPDELQRVRRSKAYQRALEEANSAEEVAEVCARFGTVVPR